MFSRFDSKYSKLLTALLIIAIVAIVGLLGFFGYDMYQKSFKTAEADKAVQLFEDDVEANNNDKKANTTQETSASVDNPFADASGVSGSGGNGSGNRNSNRTYMENYAVVGTIKIPKTNVSLPVLERVTKRSMEIAVAIIYEPVAGAGLNQVGNTVIIGHNYRNGMFFSNNKNLSNGDKITIKDESGQTITYVIYNVYETTDTDGSYYSRDTGGKREITLQTCTDDGNNRIIVCAREE